MNSTKDSDAVEAQFDDDLTNELEYSGSFVELAIEDRVKERTLEYLEAKKEADIASVSKSVFLANLSHEIRTPLNAILGYAQILDREADLETAHARYVDSILKGARHLLSLVNGVLDISKIEAGHIEITPREFDFYAVMETIESLAQSYVAQGGVEYRSICEANVPRFIQADETRMRQVVVNLVSNAFKFTDEGSVTVRAGYEDFPRRQLIIAVEDTGIGISDEEIDEVFKPFSQSGHASASDRAKGTGLGLAISKEIVRLMGGSIKVESELGQGARFVVVFPVAEAEQAEREKQGVMVTGLLRESDVKKILIVDDNQDAAYLSCQLLESIGFDVEVVGDGLEAVEKFHRWNPDLILMDQRMPRLDGIKATQMIRGSQGESKPVIIIISASAFEEDREKCLSSGANSFLEKPFLEDDLLKEISYLMNIQYTYGPNKNARNGTALVADDVILDAHNLGFATEFKHSLLIGDQAECLSLIERMKLEEDVKGWLVERVNSFEYDKVLELLDGEAESEVISI